MLRLYN